MVGKISRSPHEWKELLTPEEYRVTRERGTEPAFTGEFVYHKADGKYLCVGCGLDLFDSRAKFDSGTGWPSFWEPVESGHVETSEDKSLFMPRTEIHCARCGGHLGHVFPDGPEPTGFRYCINSASLDFAPRAKA